MDGMGIPVFCFLKLRILRDHTTEMNGKFGWFSTEVVGIPIAEIRKERK